MTQPLLEQLNDELAGLVDRVLPCVVALSGTGPELAASGSGFVLDTEGHVVTNHHVIKDLTAPFDAVLHSQGSEKASVLGVDRYTDLALLRLESPSSSGLNLRKEPARLGEICIGIGSPFGMYPESVSLGVVSGLARTIPQATGRPIERALQTDAAINPGNSGGPLVDIRGDVIGVNQCVDSRGSSIGFAIPSETIRWVSQELLEHGEVVRAALGVTVVARPIVFEGETRTGLAVTRTHSVSKHGLRVGDVMLSVDGETVDETSDLYQILTRDKIGKPVELEVLRGDHVLSVQVAATRLEA